MDKITEKILHAKVLIVAVFLILTAVSLIASQLVEVNYNIMDYLPDDAPSTVALDIMDEQYQKGTPNARVMLRDTAIPEVLEYKKRIAAVKGVEEVTWLDDEENIYQPIEFMDRDTVKTYYIGSNALLTVTLDEDIKADALDAIKEICGDKGAYSGTAVEAVAAQQETTKEISKIIKIVVVIILVILLLTTGSWLEPVLFLVTIGVAIALNKGTNLFLGEISFVTNAAGSVLQLAVSMDYSIFLLNSFEKFRREYPNDPRMAMACAVKKSVGSIMSSGLTTVTGFAALILMRFKIGPDMGIVMVKSIVLSLISVLMFMPSLVLCTYKLIDKTKHKMLFGSFDRITKAVIKMRVPVLVIFAVITVPCIFAQRANTFTYGSNGIYAEGTRVGDDVAEIESIFGKSNLVVLMVPRDTMSEEKALAQELKAMEGITSVVTYSETVGASIPSEFVPKDQLSQLISRDYSRYVITIDYPAEGEATFAKVDEIKAAAQRHYPDKYKIVGNSVSSYDLKDVVTADSVKVNLVSVLAIALILFVNFKSLSLPVILLAVIESSIWINLSVPYFTDLTLFYIGYLIISSIQLGATVDYAILFADEYKLNRQRYGKREAVEKTLSSTLLSILTSGGILAVSGFTLGAFSTNGLISQLGVLIGRGALLSMVLVIFVLPAIIYTADGIIKKTTLKANFK